MFGPFVLLEVFVQHFIANSRERSTKGIVRLSKFILVGTETPNAILFEVFNNIIPKLSPSE
jgi:hypothetical protein